MRTATVSRVLLGVFGHSLFLLPSLAFSVLCFFAFALSFFLCLSPPLFLLCLLLFPLLFFLALALSFLLCLLLFSLLWFILGIALLLCSAGRLLLQRPPRHDLAPRAPPHPIAAVGIQRWRFCCRGAVCWC